MIFGTFQNLEPYLKIHYIAPEEKLETDLPKGSYKGDISEGYVPTSREQRREMWNQEMKEIFLKEYQMNEEEAQAVIDEMEDMDIENACRYLEENYQFYGCWRLFFTGIPEKILMNFFTRSRSARRHM